MSSRGFEYCRECVNMLQVYHIATAAYLEQKHLCDAGEASRLLSDSHQSKRKLLAHVLWHREKTLAEEACREQRIAAKVASAGTALKTAVQQEVALDRRPVLQVLVWYQRLLVFWHRSHVQ